MSNQINAAATSNSTATYSGGDEPAAQLPTLQRNALRKIFGRREFTPQDVALLGYRRLQKAEGIGNKGLLAIRAWLQQFGYDVVPPVIPPNHAASQVSRRVRIERAVRLLKIHGYNVSN